MEEQVHSGLQGTELEEADKYRAQGVDVQLSSAARERHRRQTVPTAVAITIQSIQVTVHLKYEIVIVFDGSRIDAPCIWRLHERSLSGWLWGDQTVVVCSASGPIRA